MRIEGHSLLMVSKIDRMSMRYFEKTRWLVEIGWRSEVGGLEIGMKRRDKSGVHVTCEWSIMNGDITIEIVYREWRRIHRVMKRDMIVLKWSDVFGWLFLSYSDKMKKENHDL